MKVGILSLSSGYNFGGTLQSVALSKALTRLGHDVTMLDYWPVSSRKVAPWRGWGLSHPDRFERIRKRWAEIRHLRPFTEKYDAFKKRELKWTNRCFDRQALDNEAAGLDAVVVGSDQVWNLRYHPDPNYYLAGLEAFKGLKISYAACCGNPAQGCPDWTGEALKDFDHVSVRNAFTADWVKRCSVNAVSPSVVADPTLLVDDYPAGNLQLPGKYIAVYFIGMGSDEEDRKAISKLRRRHGDLPVVCLMPTGISIRFRDCYDEILWNLDPFEWVEVIRRATAVYTDSFHAILFSMRNRVPFLATYVEEVRAPRLMDLRDRFGLDSMIRQASDLGEEGTLPDWERIKQQFAEDRVASLRYLEGALG